MQNNEIVESKKNDGKRLQLMTTCEMLSAAGLSLVELTKRAAVWVNGDEVCEPSFLLSLEGCLKQRFHYDYDFPPDLPPLVVPRSCILGIDAFELELGPGVFAGASTDKCSKLTVCVKRGDLLVFRGDLWHAGAMSSVECMRLHWFHDQPTVPGGSHPSGYTIMG